MGLSPPADIGFVGIGVMGASMARNLMNAGYRLHLHSRTKPKAQALLDSGALWADSPATLASCCTAIITMVGFPSDVESVYWGSEGLFSSVKPECLLIDMTTSRPDLAGKIYQEARHRQCQALDAPVSGGDIGAREARLSIMVGGDQKAFDAAKPLFEAMGKTIVYQGRAGSGQHTKMVNQIAIASTMVGMCEALTYAEGAGLDLSTVLQSISGGAAGSWSLTNLAPRIIAKDYRPGFYVKHFVKDLGIALESARAMGLDLPGLSLAKTLYEQLASHGGGEWGTQALIEEIRNSKAERRS